MTKNDTYAALIALGMQRGYVAVPEFRVAMRNVEAGQTQGAAEQQVDARRKDIDLAWLSPIGPPDAHQTSVWPDRWNLIAAFEIEGCGVSLTDPRGFPRHVRDLPLIQNANHAPGPSLFVVLYTTAFDRAPMRTRNPETIRREIDRYRTAANNTTVQVLSLAIPGWEQHLPPQQLP